MPSGRGGNWVNPWSLVGVSLRGRGTTRTSWDSPSLGSVGSSPWQLGVYLCDLGIFFDIQVQQIDRVVEVVEETLKG